MFNEHSITQRKRRSMTLEMKMKILDQLEEGEKPTVIAKAYGINESTVRTINKRKTNIRSSIACGTLSSSQYSSYTRNPVIENMERALMIWMVDNMQKKIPMNNSMIREKAVHFFNRIKELATSIDKVDTFTASKGWFRNFKRRHSLQKHNVLLVDRKLTDIDFIHITSETQPNDKCNSDYKETDSITAENLCKALELAKKLESVIIYNDPNIQRVSKFRQDLIKCCSEYQQIYKNLVKEKIENKSSKKINNNNENDVDFPNISSDESDMFVPIKKKKLNYSSDSDIK